MSVGWQASVLTLALALAHAARAQGAGDDSLIAYTRQLLEARSRADSFSGAVLIARNGSTLYRAAHGFADRDRGVPNRPDTKFNLGSIDKLITRIAVWQLVAERKLELDAPVGRYLPDYPNKDVREKVTARRLFDMSAGIPNWFNEAYTRRHAEIRTVDDYLSLFAHEPLQFEPGTSRAYSNGGYVVLGKLIERLSGRSYYDYVRDRITGPLGMSDTRHYLVDEPVANRAVGYTRQGQGGGGDRLPNSWSLAGRGSPAGGGYSTVDDFLKLDAAIRAGRLIPAPFTDSLLPAGYRAGTPMRSAGGGPGVNAEYVAFADGWTLIAFSNYDPSGASDVVQEIAKRLGKQLPAGQPLRIRRPAG